MPDDSRIAEAFRRLLRAEVYLPLPAALALLFALVVFSASLTVIVTYWPASAPELAENPRLARLEAELGPALTSPVLGEPQMIAAKPAPGHPLAALELSGRAAPVAEGKLVAGQGLLPLRHANAAGEGAALAPVQFASLDIPPAAAPGNPQRMKAEPLPPFAGGDLALTGAPVAEILLPGAIPPGASARSEAKQILLPRKYAIATPSPERLLPAPGAEEGPGLSADDFFPGENGKAWRKFAAAVPPGAEDKPKIVIVIDDLGNAPAMTEALAALEGPLTLAFLPYAAGLAEQTRLARARGHELMVHLPMEPQGSGQPGPRALTRFLSDAELAEALEWNLGRFEGFVGVNNHMGSRLTEDERVMRLILGELKGRGLLFLDSLTTANSVAGRVAASLHVPTATRDVFLDNEPSDAAIQAQLMVLERRAKEQGFAIAIGHPNRATLRALESWIPSARARGFALVPLSAVVEFEGKRRLAAAGRQ